MKLIGFRVTNYRSILDSGWVDLESLTTLVGKNESGKTSLLRALHKFKPYQNESYVIDREWPRGRRNERSPNAVVCSIRVLLDRDEQRDLRAATELRDFTMAFEIRKSYDGSTWIELDRELFPETPRASVLKKLIDGFTTSIVPVPGAISDGFQKCTLTMLEYAGTGKTDELAKSEALVRNLLSGDNPSALSQAERDYIDQYVAKVKSLASAIQSAASVRRIIGEYLLPRIPVFIYMDDYRIFHGTARLDQVHQRKQQNAQTDEDLTLTMIMELAGLDPDEEFQKGNNDDPGAKEQRQYDLNDASLSLTQEISSRWKQRRYEVEFRADGQSFFTMVKDESGHGLIPLEDRSKGFQWFFSFDLLFMHESNNTFKGCVLLLDEPGLHLHPDAQKDLLARLETYAQGNTLIYTTHLPFMIDLRQPERIRTLSETANGITVDRDLNLSQPEAKFTLQAALGMSASQSYLVAQKNLVVEGVDDFWFLSELSNLIARSDGQALPDDVLISASGGAAEAVYMATFMIGQKLDVTVLFDSDAAGDIASDKLIKNWLTRYRSQASVLKVGEVLGLGRDAAIEDVFDEDYYKAKVLDVYGGRIRAKGREALELVGGGQIVKRVERFLEQLDIPFNKGSVAKVIRNDLIRQANFARLEETTRERASKLIGALAATFR